MNYFELYNLPEQFELDLVKLKQHYQTLQKLTHPDRFATASEQQKRMYLTKNAQINDAYSVLQSPISRGEHLLELRGVELASEQDTVGDVEFLMEQMEWREALEDADSVEALEKLVADNHQVLAQQEQAIAALLLNNNEQDNQSAAQELRKMKFMIKLASEIDTKMDRMTDS
ncbi:Fe-S protein assembly co-chaperone HscB [Glaciecola sp.]|jgi:molecular chaperone HscB|uniref:Fe-S protein assembly co-chaperone HscB n=1 Tax=Glaciecola sp. MF2-115 TaxID=3384827 RepID=UPI003988CE1D